MNIVEAYIKFNGQLFIAVSGLPMCGKSILTENIARDFKLHILNQFDYYKQNYDVSITLPDGTNLINYYTDDAIDWDKLNDDINKFKKKGVIVRGISFPTNKINSQIDYHIHLSISKQLCIEKRKKFLEENKEKFKDQYDLIDSTEEKLKMNTLIYPFYLESRKNTKIDKFINTQELTDNQIYDVAFDGIIEMIQKYLYQKNKNNTIDQIARTPKVSQISKSCDSDTFSASIEILDNPKYLNEQEIDAFNKLFDDSSSDYINQDSEF